MQTLTGKTVVIQPYSARSKSAKALSEALSVPLVRSADHPRTAHLFSVVNWGSGGNANGLNKPSAVSKAVNKVSTFTYLKSAGVRTPDWTTNREEAKQWFREGATVMCRTKIYGHSGQGIIIRKPEDGLDIPSAPLYTKFVDKDKEYRVHVFNGKVIDCRVKQRATDGRAITSNHICTHTNGYVFNFATAPDDVAKQAIAAVKALGLDFGAVDVMAKVVRQYANTIDGHTDAYVLEVNTAPGIQGSTINAYVKAIRDYYGITETTV